jgi:cytoskeletal protein RodZ
MPSTPFGEHLKREREMRGVSLEEISAATRIAPRFLVALENEQWDQLPGGVFNRGFIRAVARFLGLDEDSLVSEYALETKGRSDPGVVADPPIEPNSRYLEMILVIVLAALLIAGVVFAAIHFGPQLAARWHKHSAQSATVPSPTPGDSH